MKVLILAEQRRCEQLLNHLCGVQGDINFIHGQDVLDVRMDPAKVDAIIGGDSSPGSDTNSLMLAWRSHPHTYLIPCWFTVKKKSLDEVCLWPGLAIDRFNPQCDAGSFSEWLLSIVDWQQERMHFNNSGVFKDRSGLELATSLCLRRATGVLSVFDDDGGEGRFHLRDGNLVSAVYKHLYDVEAFYELLCIPFGGYSWDNTLSVPNEMGGSPLSQLIPDGLKLIHDANFLYHFVSSLDQRIKNTDSQSALDDSASQHFTEQKKIYGLTVGGVPVSQVIEASPLSRPSTMAILAKWFSLEDVTVVGEQPSQSRCSVLIVDDSALICRVLQGIFGGDPRMRVAGVAHDGIEALRLIGELKPDVVTLDLQMPKMDGITALKHILIRDPRPVVVLSAFTKTTSQQTYESFKYGAVDVITKPDKTVMSSSESQNRELCDRIVHASRVQLTAARYVRRGKKADADHSGTSGTPAYVRERIMVVICGAGGFPALLKLIFALPDAKCLPPTIIGVDMPRHVVEALVANLKKDAPVPVEEISGNGQLFPGICYIFSNEDRYHILDDGIQIRVDSNGAHTGNGFFDDLLMSAADSLKSCLVTILLSGAGVDGLEGIKRVKQAGGQVFSLAPGACLRPDLPQKAISIGCAKELKDIESLSELFRV